MVLLLLQFLNPNIPGFFNGRFVLAIIAVPSCARLLRAEDVLSGEFQIPQGLYRGPALRHVSPKCSKRIRTWTKFFGSLTGHP